MFTGKCHRCGQCCINAVIGLNNIAIGKDSQELGRWLSFHRCDPVEIDNGQVKVLGVRIPLICQHVEFDSNGMANCRIYEDRPVICREHFCKRVIDEVVRGLADDHSI